MKIPPIVQDTQEVLAIVGARIKRMKRRLITNQGDVEKMINEVEKIEKVIQRREEEIKKFVEQEVKKDD